MAKKSVTERNSKHNTPTTGGLWITIGGVFVALLAITAILIVSSLRESKLQITPRPISRVRLRPEHQLSPFANQIASKGEPIVITGTVADTVWKARKWTPDDFATLVPMLRGVGEHTNHTFMYFQDHRPLARLPSVAKLAEQVPIRKDMTSAELFAILSRSSKPPSSYYYFSESIEALGPAVRDGLEPLTPFVVQEKGVRAGLKGNVWLGLSGSTTWCHYDWSHNFHAQLWGRKRFLLFPPHAWVALGLYPYLHPRATKCIAIADAPAIAPIEAVLSPGEVLYIPPLWFHHVSALDSPTLSVSLWSPSRESVAMDTALAEPLPFSAGWDRTHKQQAALVFTSMLLLRLYNALLAQQFVARLVAYRYAPLAADVPELFDESTSWTCPALPPAELHAALRAQFAPSLEALVASFTSMQPDTLELWLGDYVEIVANEVLTPDVTAVVPFLECITTYLKLV